MNQYRKRPVVVTASQWFKDGDHPDVYGFPGDGLFGAAWIMTLEGPLRVSPGDWIITGVKGEHYPCKPDIFAATYEAVAEEHGEREASKR